VTAGLKETDNVVVVGASAAGLAAADGLREGGFEGSITVLGAELHHPYDRPTLSKGLLLGRGEPELLEIRSAERHHHAPSDWYSPTRHFDQETLNDSAREAMRNRHCHGRDCGSCAPCAGSD